MKVSLSKITIAVACCSSLAAQAIPLWTVIPLTPTNPAISNQGTAIVSYQVTNQSAKTHMLNFIPVPGVSQLATAGSCTSPFVLNYQQSCVLNLLISGSSLTQDITEGPEICQYGSELQCYQPSVANRLNVSLLPKGYANISASPLAIQLYTNSSVANVNVVNNSTMEPALNVTASFNGTAANQISSTRCDTISPAGNCNLTLTASRSSVPFSIFTIQGTNTNVINAGIAVSAPFAYIANDNGNLPVTLCNLNAAGNLNNCQAAIPAAQLGNNAAYTLAVNETNSIAYVSISNQGIYYCAVASNGSYSNCTLTTGLQKNTANLQGIALNNTNNIAYVTDVVDGSYHSCVINSNGDLNPCSESGNLFTSPIGITLNSQNSYAYVMSNNSGVYKCAVNGSSLTDCMLNTTVNARKKIVFNNTGTTAYLTEAGNANQYIQICEVNSTDGSLSNCVNTGNDANGNAITGTYGIALNAANTQAYLANHDSNTFYICQISAVNGQLSDCALTNVEGSSNPYDVVLAH